MKVDQKGTDLIILFDKVNSFREKPFLEIKCNLVDTTEYIEITKCNISAKINIRSQQHDRIFNGYWKIDKITKYEIENLQKDFNLDQSAPKEIKFFIKNMTIEPKSYTQICTLKQTTMDINNNDFACVNISLPIDTTKSILTSTPINQDILDKNISNTNKLWWSLVILILPVTVILSMYFS
ncbi:hypothetical protein RF11_03096 [Thelohanellus kitauei]|uniref:Uncharacterized protein n=1 Tax=Thelohanellus kitauei TaxID=669202 RepID=A0A0C2IGW5_THEKT|nr:hypothetical protein RF11_03096 [Thelohanellus kitauei]